MDKRVQKTRASIREAYISLLMEKKSLKMTVTELARRADIDRKTFYLHYDTTDDVLKDCNQQVIQKLLKILQEQNFFSEVFNTACLYSAMNQVVSEQIDFFRHIAMMECADSFWEQSKEALAVGVSDIYKEKVNISQEALSLYSRFVLTGTIEIYREWLKGNLSFTLDELGKLTSEVAIHGFCTALKTGG